MLDTGDPGLRSCIHRSKGGRQGQCSSFSLHHNQSHLKINEFSWKKVANALSLANMVLGLFSIFCSFNRKSHCASWMLLMSFLLDIVVGAMTRHLNICCKTGAELNDFAIFTTFGLASGLLLGVDGPLNGFVAIVYVLTTSFRLGFYSSGECNTDQSYYPRDDVLESENWKKVVYVGVGMKMTSSSGSCLSSCLLTLIFLQRPEHVSGDAGKFYLVSLGDTAELLCPLSLWPMTVPEQVRWLRPSHQQDSQAVHLFLGGKDRNEDVRLEYKGRTELVRDLQEGKVSLRIRNVSLEDKGQYQCQIQVGNLTREGTVTLQVAAWEQLSDVSLRMLIGGLFQSHLRKGSHPQQWLWLWSYLFCCCSSQQAFMSSGSKEDQKKIFWKTMRKKKEDFIKPSQCYLLNLVLCHFRLFRKLKLIMKVKCFESIRHRGNPNSTIIKDMKEDFQNCFRKWQEQWEAVTLDPDTAHPKLILSEDRRCVRLGDRKQTVPNNPQRFDFVVSILGSEYFTAGCHYWEVHVGGKTKWILGVCSESVSRKGKITASPANGHWLVRQCGRNEYEALTSPQTYFRLKEPLRCVGIFLDYEAGIISFYNVTSKSHIFTFTHSFSGPLRPFFEPCLHDGGENTAPLIICSELQKSEESTVPKPKEKAHANGDVALKVNPSLLPPQSPELFPLNDVILSWPSDLGPALQKLKVPSF
ncbi:Erythroid membrane-associated protein [Fukomys damarensis]|uniref:Erythroid membrane-associated protein n=1 Tax=Fukomys damarensis TaxID=885580 RepID=A0A091E5B8_FUKDA|nr:Erythroid membrane-associated protein [Fukomys damarensis]